MPVLGYDVDPRWTMKSWTTKHGSLRAGSLFNKPSLLRLLTNPPYVGKIEHKGALYAGEQPAIIEPELWEEINAELRAAQRGQNNVIRTKQQALLDGILFCR